MTRVAIVGRGLDGLRMWEALVRCGSVDVVAFIDSDVRLHGRERLGLPIRPPAWLAAHTFDVAIADADLPELQGPLLTLGVTTNRIVRLPLHLDADAVAHAAASRYPDSLASTLAHTVIQVNTRVGIFGTGAAAVKVWEALTELDGVEPIWFADNDVRRQGGAFLWCPVIAPAAIPRHAADAIVVGTMSRDAVHQQLLTLGVPADRILGPDVSADVEDIRSELQQRLPAGRGVEVHA
jgi:hypothetical protein